MGLGGGAEDSGWMGLQGGELCYHGELILLVILIKWRVDTTPCQRLGMHLHSPQGLCRHSGQPPPGAHGKLYPRMDSVNSWLVLAWASCPEDGRKAEVGVGLDASQASSSPCVWGGGLDISFYRMLTLTIALTFKGGSLMPGVLRITILVDSPMSP